ncbi:phosphate ABC transporter substrate-binding protein PstS family protein [Halobacillus litoralis]|uniref:Phosphate-binding protein n=1 Tax=Halobacillus litoralis TaxID=45668 RepID=A0A845E270_9BACI|nr:MULTISPECIES: PstS family phosphate ABC transporter substrate-binding protein [Halobacillus]MCA1021394.1 PstS family phosphate ABC transporter substrate-binding protein [Halobacillus litoralis]MYL19784.1 phosphate ABC transporter substrate-binding protein PstS family protein [Halobacillus litoralis]MYL28930.1 phosphate ABC transporter substrate-binding protein PstS family protein [Halobacillus halophilus]
MKNFKSLALMLAFILVVGVLAACGGSEEGNTEEQDSANGEGSGEESSEEVSGPIDIDGSSTVFPIMENLTYSYQQEQPEVDATLNSSGSGGGFKKSTVGEIDLSNASREIKEEEMAIAEENDITLEPLELAYDGLSVVVSAENDFAEELTIEQLKQIFLDSSDAQMWSDINPDWPEEEIKIFSPGHDSGTFDYFNEVVLEEEPMKEGENTTLSEDDNVLVRGIKDNPNAIGFFGYAYYAENEDSLKALAISEGEGEAVEPTPETIQDGSYTPLSRPLFTYVNVNAYKEKAQVRDFVEYTLNNAGKAAEEVGYVALPDEKYQEQLDMVSGWAE